MEEPSDASAFSAIGSPFEDIVSIGTLCGTTIDSKDGFTFSVGSGLGIEVGVGLSVWVGTGSVGFGLDVGAVVGFAVGVGVGGGDVGVGGGDVGVGGGDVGVGSGDVAPSSILLSQLFEPSFSIDASAVFKLTHIKIQIIRNMLRYLKVFFISYPLESIGFVIILD